MPADDKKKARLNCIAHLLAQMPDAEVQREPVLLPPRERHERHEDDCVRHPVPAQMIVPARYRRRRRRSGITWTAAARRCARRSCW